MLDTEYKEEVKTKAKTLSLLEKKCTFAKVMPQFCFTVADWQTNTTGIIEKIIKEMGEKNLIARSSAAVEDSKQSSFAGHFVSVANIDNCNELTNAIEQIIDSYGQPKQNEEIFVQKMVENITVSGVAFTRDPNTGGHYFVINYDEHSGLTNTVTSGSSNALQVCFYDKTLPCDDLKNQFSTLLKALKELETLFSSDSLDVEFAINTSNELYIFQVRPLILRERLAWSENQHSLVLAEIKEKIDFLNKPHPYLCGTKTVFGVMPDWNPAEIIGIRPKPLALSLYKTLITDGIWAYQRDNYGYRNLRGLPLLISFAGLPYIDVRASFNSFIPADITDDLAIKLVNHYIEQLCLKPNFHDKVEFEIIYSCYTLDLPERLNLLLEHGFAREDCQKIIGSLRLLTNRIINKESGLWQKDIQKIAELEKRHQVINGAEIDAIGKMYWLLEDCKRFGTLPFAGLARAGFIAVQLLRSLISVGIINTAEYESFMNSLNTINSQMSLDLIILEKEDFLKKYGHLRPGTYDILSLRYDENPDYYFSWTQKNDETVKREKKAFSLSLPQLNKLNDLLEHHGFEHDILSFFDFIKKAIEGREYAKFAFTKNLSDIMKLLCHYGNKFSISRNDLSFLDINIIQKLYTSSDNPKKVLLESIAEGKDKYNITQRIALPPLIVSSEDVYSFKLPMFEANYITLKSFSGQVASSKEILDKKLAGKIIMISSADPGFDWIFSCNIGAFITMYGGANSHMAIRALELGIPAIIGAGEILFNKWSGAEVLEIDCANRQVRIIK